MKNKRILFFVMMLLIAVQVNAQDVTQDSLKMEKVFGGYRFYQGDKLIAPANLEELMSVNEKAKEQIRSAKGNWLTAGIIGGVGGFLIGYPLGTALAGGEPNWTLAGVGAGFVLISIPITHAGNKKAKSAVDIYNNNLITSSSRKLQYNLAISSKGLGFQIKF